MQKREDLSTELIEVINEEIVYIEMNIMNLKDNENLKAYVNFSNIQEMLSEYKEKIKKIKELKLISNYNYNENFINYIKEEKEKIESYFSSYKNEVFEKSISKIKSNEVNYENIKISKEYMDYGGGRPQLLNSDEEIIFNILYLEKNMKHFLGNLDDFLNNLYILKDFSEIDANVVIIGSNGSGKSTLSRRLKIDNAYQSINIISSHHILHLTSDNFIIPRHANEVLDIDTYQQEKKLVTEDEPFDYESFMNSLHNLVNYLLNLHHSEKGDTSNQTQKETILEKILKICTEVLKKKLMIKNGIIVCGDENLGIYDFNQMSDGERQVFYFVASVLAKENDGYIIVDEPENHLNSQICNLLWSKLEELKSNSTFVYITHDPKFATSRTNAKIVWSQSFKYPNRWEYKVLENNELPEELLIEVLGSKENIIFCEGKSEGLDKQIYDSIYTNEKVMAVEGHLNVVNYTKVINKMSILNLNAMGIIDSDGKTNKEIEKYGECNILALPFNEAEMLLLSEEVLEETKKCFGQYSEEIDIEEWKNEIFDICSQNEEKILMNIIKARVDNKLTMQKIQKFNEISDIKSELTNLVESINVDEIYQNEKEKFREILNEKNYHKLLKLCSLKNEIIKQVPYKFNFHNYEKRAIGVIKSTDKLKEKLKKKYFKNL